MNLQESLTKSLVQIAKTQQHMSMSREHNYKTGGRVHYRKKGWCFPTGLRKRTYGENVNVVYK